MTTTTGPNPPAPVGPPHLGGGQQLPEAPPKLKRRPYLWVIGVVLVCFGGLISAWVATTVSGSTQVIALRENVDRGQVIEKEDLMKVPISGDRSLDTIPASDIDDLIGQRAARDLTEGTLLADEAVTSEVIPAEGESLVGIALTPGQIPSTDVRPGDTVRFVNTPRAQEEVGGEPELTVDATVVRVSRVDETGQYVVDVTVPESDASLLAALAATGRVALVVDGGK